MATISVLFQVLLVVIGGLIGGGLVFGVMKLTDDSSGSGSGSCNSTSSNSTSSNSTGSRVSDSLKFVVLITRHGNKGVSYDYPDDPYPHNDTEYWPYGSGALTPKGRVQAYTLGQTIRSLYNGFLPSTFVSDNVYASADTCERVVMSGELVLAGLYPPEGFQVWDQNVDWQPIALLTDSPDNSIIIGSCAKAVQDESAALSLLLQEEAANITAMSTLVYEATEANLTGETLGNLFQKLSSEDAEGYAIPSWAKTMFLYSLRDYYGKWYAAQTIPSVEVVRLYVGELLEDIVDSMNSKINGSLPNRKLSYYSGHDSTILNMQRALGVSNSSIIKTVDVASALITELHQDPVTSEYYVQVLYIDGRTVNSEPTNLTLNCGATCDFDTFYNSTLEFTNVSYDTECEDTSSTNYVTNLERFLHELR